MQTSEKGKALIFFTDNFPYGKGEAFIENEFPYLHEAFNKIILVSSNVRDNSSRVLPADVRVIRYAQDVNRLNKLKAASSYFTRTVQEEIRFIKNSFGLPADKQIVFFLLGSYSKAIETGKFLQNLIEEEAKGCEIYLYSYWMNDMALSIARYKKYNPRVKAFCRAHSWDIYFERHSPAYLPFRNFILKHIDACYAISENGADYLNKKTNNRYAHKISIARLGTIHNKFMEANPGETLQLISCSNVVPLKRIHLIIETLAGIDDLNINWTHFGSGSLMNEVQQQATAMLDKKINIRYRFAGMLSNRELMQYYGTHPVDLFINVSDTEGIPVSIMEAYSFSIPAIATNVGGVSEVVNESNGFLIDVNSSTVEIAATIRHYATLPAEVKQRFRENAFHTWNTLYNAQKNYTAFISSIMKL